MKKKEKGQFVMVPYAVLNSGIDDGCLRLWIEIMKFPKGNTSTNKVLAKELGIKPRTVTNRLRILKEKSLVTYSQKTHLLGHVIRVLIANTSPRNVNVENSNGEELTLQDVIKQENEKKMATEGFGLTHKEVGEIKKRYENNAQ